MGSSESKTQNEEALCGYNQHRLQFMKAAISSRNAFFAALTVYGISLKNTGAAFTDGIHPKSSHIPSPKTKPNPLEAEEISTARESFSNPQQEEDTTLQSGSWWVFDEDMKPKPLSPTLMETRKCSTSTSSNQEQEIWAVDELRKTMQWESCWPDSDEKEVKTNPLLPTVMENEELVLETEDYEEPRLNCETRDTQGNQEMELPKCTHQKSPLDCVICMPDSDLDSEDESRMDIKSNSNRGDATVPYESSWDYYFMPQDSVSHYFRPQDSVEEWPVVIPNVLKKRGVDIGKRSRPPVSLMHLFSDLDDHFLKAFESTLEVSQMLESNNSNFAHNQPNGQQIDHSERVINLITRDQPFKGKDDFDTEEIETFATVLNKMLDWEMNLYDEIKAREVVKYEYQKKVSMLNKQKKKGRNCKSLEKLKVAISHLHTRYIVENQSVDSTVAEINRIRDEQLYPKLAQLVDGMAMMWKTMLFHHESQFNNAYHLKSLDDFQVLMETSEHHYRSTTQLFGAVCDLYTQFCGLIEYQKDFIRALHSWLKLSLNPIETNSTQNVYSPRGFQNAPIHSLVTTWKNDLDNLPDEIAKNAIRNFASVIQTVMREQDNDLKMREKRATTRKELEDCEELNSDKQARETHLASLRHSLPELFRAMSEIAQACSGMYHNLRNIAEHL